MAGHACSRRRAVRVTAPEQCSATCGKSQRSVGTPASSARRAEQTMSAVAWSTVHWLECQRLYGKARGRLRGPGRAICSAESGAGKAASGLPRATSLNRDHSAAMSPRSMLGCHVLGGSQRILYERVLLHDGPDETGCHLDRCHEVGRPRHHLVGPALRLVLAGVAARAAGPGAGLTGHHDHGLALAGRHGGQGVVDQFLLRHADLVEHRARFG